jgi:hypothetical protein
MVLDLHGEAFLARIQGRPLGDRPRLQNPVDLESEVVVQAGSIVLLNDEAR